MIRIRMPLLAAMAACLVASPGGLMAHTITADKQIACMHAEQGSGAMAIIADNSTMSHQATALLDNKPFAIATKHEYRPVFAQSHDGPALASADRPDRRSQSSLSYCSMINNGTGSGAIARMCDGFALLHKGHYDLNMGTAALGKEAAYASFTAGGKKSDLRASYYLRRSTSIAYGPRARHVLNC